MNLSCFFGRLHLVLPAILFQVCLFQSARVFGQRPELLNDLFLHQWVQVDGRHEVQGTVLGLGELEDVLLPDVHVLLLRNGSVINKAKSDERGRFVLKGVTPGSYSCVAAARTTVAAFSLQVLDSKVASHLPKELEVTAIHKGGRTVRQLLTTQTLPTTSRDSYEMQEYVSDPIQETRKFADSSSVQLDDQGRLVGRLALNSRNQADANVFILRGSQQVARAQVDGDGRFEISGLKPGVYSFVAAGSESFGALAFRVTAAPNNAEANGNKLISFNQSPCCPVLHCETIRCYEVYECIRVVAPECIPMVVTPPQIVDPSVKPVDPSKQTEPAPTQPVKPEDEFIPGLTRTDYFPNDVAIKSQNYVASAGGFSGAPVSGYGGGGGSGGGGGGRIGLGGIAAIGGLTALGIIAADNNNDNAAVMSPIVP